MTWFLVLIRLLNIQCRSHCKKAQGTCIFGCEMFASSAWPFLKHSDSTILYAWSCFHIAKVRKRWKSNFHFLGIRCWKLSYVIFIYGIYLDVFGVSVSFFINIVVDKCLKSAVLLYLPQISIHQILTLTSLSMSSICWSRGGVGGWMSEWGGV